MKFLLDENIHKGLLRFLKDTGHDVVFSPKSLEDEEVFEMALKENRILLSRDKDFLDDKFVNSSHRGILLMRVPARDIESQVSILSKLLSEHSSFDKKVVRLLSKNKFEFL